MKITPGPELGEAIAALNSAIGSTKDAMAERATQEVDAAWKPALASAAGTNPERRLLVDGASSQIGPASIDLTAGAGGPLSGGLTSDGWAAIEFGMDPKQIEAPNRRKKIRIAGSGREMVVATRIWVGKNLRARNPDGYVIFPTVRQHGPRFVAAWIYGLISKWVGTPFEVRKG